MDKTKQIKAECIFCYATDFKLPHKGYIPNEAENIECGNCGKLNNFGDLQEVIKRKGFDLAKKEVEKMIKKIKK